MGPVTLRLPCLPARCMRAFFALAAAACCALAPAQAAALEVATARMAAQIETPVILTNPDDMNFGNIAPRGNSGTVVMTPSASAQCNTTGGIVHTGKCQAATFEGDISFLFFLRVQRPNGDRITLNGPGGATMRLDNFTFGAGPGLFDLGQNGANHRFLIFNADGTFTFTSAAH